MRFLWRFVKGSFTVIGFVTFMVGVHEWLKDEEPEPIVVPIMCQGNKRK